MIYKFKNNRNNEDSLNNLKNNLLINHFNKNKIYHLHNDCGLGDSIFNFILFYAIKDYIEKNDIKIFYYTKKRYLPQLKEFLCSKNIFLTSIEYKPNISIELWINNSLFEYRHDRQKFPMNFNKYYIFFFNKVLIKLQLNCNISKLFYKDEDLLVRYNNISDIYKEFDILILNSQPFSDQYNYNKNEWDKYIIYLSSYFKILTTSKVNDNILCTYDDNLTIKDIASLSTKAKVVIAINSGVFPGLLNYYTLLNVKHFYIFDNRCYYSYPNFTNYKNNEQLNVIGVSELKIYLILNQT